MINGSTHNNESTIKVKGQEPETTRSRDNGGSDHLDGDGGHSVHLDGPEFLTGTGSHHTTSQRKELGQESSSRLMRPGSSGRNVPQGTSRKLNGSAFKTRFKHRGDVIMAKGKKAKKSDSKKVGGGRGEKDAATDDNAKKRVPFAAKKPAEGWTDAVPEGFDFDKHLIMKKDEFATQVPFMRHRAASLTHRSTVLAAEATALETKATRYEALGDEKTRSQVKRAERIAGQLEGLIGNLKDAGVDIESILLAVKEKAEKEKAEAEATE